MPNHIHITNPADCTGCRACEQLCPQRCIRISPDQEGFLSPVVDEAACIGCGLCVQRCPQNKDFVRTGALNEPMVYAAKLKDSDVLMKSSSGGMFSAFANYVLANGGVVYGAVFDDNMAVKHASATTLQELAAMRGSKYVQSDTGHTYAKAKAQLEAGKTVLYTGCPCQIAGLRSYLGKSYDNLITADLICHGVPSPKLFKKYIDWLGKKYKGKVVSYEFRNKGKHGWGGYGLRLEVSAPNRRVVKALNPLLDPYMCGFSNSTFRHSCYSCKYTTSNRVGDITIADYWGVRKFHPEFDSTSGVSLLLISTRLGVKAFEQVANQVSVLPSTIKNASYENIHLYKSTPKPPIRDVIYTKLDTLPFDAYAKEYLSPPMVQVFKIRLKSAVPHSVKVAIKKLLKR